MRARRAGLAVFIVVAVLAAGCTSDKGSDGAGSDGADAPQNITAHGGTNQIWLRTEPNVELALYDAAGKRLETPKADEHGKIHVLKTRKTDQRGALVMRYVPAGKGYVVKRVDGSGRSNPVEVTGPEFHPPASFYEKQRIEEGYGYLTTRDGTKLAINVTLPGPPEDGPYPTVVEYSGYDPANPEPSLVTISKTLAAGQGYATVGVNIRGSGCSGGSMMLWEPTQALDGYDAVEAVAAQPWVKGHRVGMVGISYPATAMLYAASTKPPSLAAIAPMASYDDGFRALLWPGGIQNKGFARHWIEERYTNAQNPNPEDWVNKRLKGGDRTCKENLAMRGQNVDLATPIDDMPYFPEVNGLGKQFAPYTFVDQIDVPTFMVASWQDEQVGGHAPTMIQDFSTEHLYATLTNGYHTEGLAEPSVLQRWKEFLDLYVAKEVPDTSGMAGLYPAVAGQIIGDVEAAGKMPVPPERFSKDMTYDQALATYEKDPRVRVLFDEGGAASVPPGVPTAAFDETFSAYPPKEQQVQRWYLGPDGQLTTQAPSAADGSDGTVDAYTSDPSARPEVSLVKGEDSWWKLPKYDWAQPVADKALAYETPALGQDEVMLGSASADLWLRSDAPDTDLQVTLTEVRPDGKETLVQSGWLRASKRFLDRTRSTELQPLQTQRQQDLEDLPKGEFTPVRVEVYPFGHVFRKGSKVRMVISAPGGDRSVWSFVNLPGTQRNEIARSAGMPSSIAMPLVPNVAVPTPLPACPSLRGQPCRSYEPFSNATAAG